MPSYSVCGGRDFRSTAILLDGFAMEWQLSPGERAYTERRQGTGCKTGVNNLRSVALADAILAATGAPEFVSIVGG